MEKDKMIDQFQTYLSFIEDNLDDLKSIMQEYLNDRSYELDYSVSSLKSIEEMYLQQVENYSIKIISLGKLSENISTYMGEILIRTIGGHWDLCLDEEDYDYGLPMVVGMDKLPSDFAWSPLQIVTNFRKNKRPGQLRIALNATQFFDDPNKWTDEDFSKNEE